MVIEKFHLTELLKFFVNHIALKKCSGSCLDTLSSIFVLLWLRITKGFLSSRD